MKKNYLALLLINLLCFSSADFAQTSHHPQQFLQSIKGKADEGMQIVNHFCSNCHALNPLIPLGAPRIGKKNDWSPRIKQGILVLLAHTEEGFNAMPARGGCFECTDQQLVLALLALLPKSMCSTALNQLKAHKKYSK